MWYQKIGENFQQNGKNCCISTPKKKKHSWFCPNFFGWKNEKNVLEKRNIGQNFQEKEKEKEISIL